MKNVLFYLLNNVMIGSEGVIIPFHTKNIPWMQTGYGPFELAKSGIIQAFRKQFGIKGPPIFDFHEFNDIYAGMPSGQHIAVIRLVTLRKEWSSASRNPQSEYLYIAADILRQLVFL